MPMNDANCLMMSQQLLKAVKRLSNVHIEKKLYKLFTNGKGRQTLTSDNIVDYKDRGQLWLCLIKIQIVIGFVKTFSCLLAEHIIR